MRLLNQAAMVLAIALALPSSMTLAKTTLKDQISKVKKDCKTDIDNLCKGVTPGNGRIAACLDSKEDQLTPQCKGTYTQAKTSASHALDRADIAFRKSCMDDAQKFCANVPSGRGRILDCLSKHQDSLSDSCKNFQAKLEEKIDEQLG